MPIKVVTVVGARPQFVKAATISRAIRQLSDMQEVMIHTGQHFDANMSDIFFQELGIPKPQYSLDVHGGNHGQMTGRMLERIEAVLVEEKPDWVLVYGDTNSTLAGALAAAKLHIPVSHVEAGLRSFNRKMPEEVNRVLTDHVSNILFCPTSAAVQNLRDEGITDQVYHVGDVMYDATLDAIERFNSEPNSQLVNSLKGISYTLATIHRAENTNSADNLHEVLDFLRDNSTGMKIVLPLHPRTKAAAEQFGVSLDGIDIIEPVGYLEMAGLIANCTQVFTDSGGLQKEAYFHAKPCTTLRSETEWPETIEAGWNRLWKGPDFSTRKEISEFGDGRAAFAIIEQIASSS
ncbi:MULTISPECIES: non-hydrolyzing UDP-N-acetylglucosamine 2-epimerase [Thalassospira]|jgi:UDP-GlcNAc3NAcA epimerase|uniref:non-hydrolyzing UDP-N-acetylglucosamine 2-epimerase n=1 Tax=Thalassospira TaxID=168934 RepID=UPI000D7541A7|nr:MULTISPECIES: UDP-N-acetylglucosamine 2-epimerase (non-hydrolyzing) [Thalassospira]MBL4843249.1 UDP-N-acetylglucosamine 2-epimerase (non-hydrolyzing) [Thalassospira sp.]PXX34669.1 UDP-GlcNAc3NAcA epimerase [Thalassospira sp. 11-3]HBX59967.1 UDP-N-acetylglucosamine 2-epimerase (non-hydrolyzing) [Methylophaga sp.]|tara:strand:- start:1226 stop:2269 length:1044 start_codon:yes stop_codon:yes gene_type:complete